MCSFGRAQTVQGKAAACRTQAINAIIRRRTANTTTNIGTKSEHASIEPDQGTLSTRATSTG